MEAIGGAAVVASDDVVAELVDDLLRARHERDGYRSLLIVAHQQIRRMQAGKTANLSACYVIERAIHSRRHKAARTTTPTDSEVEP